MKKKTVRKDIWRTITHSWGRFISIFCLIALGAFALIGLKVTGPNMRETAIDFYQQTNLADVSVMSTYGLDQEDKKIIEGMPDIKAVEFGYFYDSLIKGSETSIRLFSKPDELSQYEVMAGKLPTEKTEIALDFSLENQYKIGQTIVFTDNNGKPLSGTIEQSEYKITGFVRSSELLDRNNLGSTMVGTGQLNTYGVVMPVVFHTDVYTIARMSFLDTAGLAAYSQEYIDKVNGHQTKLQDELEKRPQERLAVVKKEQQQQLDQEQQTSNASQAQLAMMSEQLAVANQSLQQAESQFDEKDALFQQQKQAAEANPEVGETFQGQLSATQEQLDTMKAQLTKQKSDYQKSRGTLEQKQSELKAAQQQLAEAQQKLDSLALPVYVVNTREGNPGYQQYFENSQRMAVLSNIFPVFLFAIAAMVSLTTMTRMVDEQRINMGTLKAFGYSNHDILKKFVIYGFTASVSGAVVGIALGHTVLPRVIFKASAATFTFESLHLSFYLGYTLIALVIAIACTVGSALMAAGQELKENAATLLIPKPPKSGTRILLERISPLWNRLSFNYKVTARNLFRYKKRMLMTILGVAGCTALLITGFGIKDSLNGIVQQQFEHILHYDLMSVYNNQAPESQITEYQEAVATNKNISRSMAIHYDNLHVEAGKHQNQQAITLMVPENQQTFSDFISLQNRQTGTTISFQNEGIIITEKLAELLDVKVGGLVQLYDSENQKRSFMVASITEMYVGHYIFLTPDYYQKVFGQKGVANADLITLKNNSSSQLVDISSSFMKLAATQAIVQSSQVKATANGIMEGLNRVIVVLILCASILAFVVMYNLTNINVSERIRELSTIKVLGFYELEVTMYIYRETFILTILGVLAGAIIGMGLHGIIIQTLPPDNAMFSPGILISNYGMSTAVTVIISIFVMFLMYLKLRKINMLDALKSVD